MSKSFTFLIIVTTTVIVLSVFGIIASGTSNILTAINFDNPGSFKFSELFLAIFDSVNGLFAGGAALAGIVVGYLATKSPGEALTAGFIGLLGGWISADLISIITTSNGLFLGELAWIATLIKMVALILLAGLVVSLVQLWRGND